MVSRLIDRIAAHVGAWALRRHFGADCPTDVRDDFLGDKNAQCASCDARRLIDAMREAS